MGQQPAPPLDHGLWLEVTSAFFGAVEHSNYGPLAHNYLRNMAAEAAYIGMSVLIRGCALAAPSKRPLPPPGDG